MEGTICARACVELDVTGKVPSRVRISVGEQSFFQDVVVEGGITYCSKCKKHGHDVTTCKKMAKARIVASEGKNLTPPEGKDLTPPEGDKGQNPMKENEQHDSSQQNVDESGEIIPSRPTTSHEEQGVIPPTVMEVPEREQGENSKFSPCLSLSEHLAMVIYKGPKDISLAADPMTTISTDQTGVISHSSVKDPVIKVAASESVSPPISEWTQKKWKNKGKKSSIVIADPSYPKTELPLSLRRSSRSKSSLENSDFVYHANGKDTRGKARKKVSFSEAAKVMYYEEVED